MLDGPVTRCTCSEVMQLFQGAGGALGGTVAGLHFVVGASVTGGALPAVATPAGTTTATNPEIR